MGQAAAWNNTLQFLITQLWSRKLYNFEGKAHFMICQNQYQGILTEISLQKRTHPSMLSTWCWTEAQFKNWVCTVDAAPMNIHYLWGNKCSWEQRLLCRLNFCIFIQTNQIKVYPDEGLMNYLLLFVGHLLQLLLQNPAFWLCLCNLAGKFVPEWLSESFL